MLSPTLLACRLPAHAEVVQGLQKQFQAEPSAACRAVSYALHSKGVQQTCQTLVPGSTLMADILLPEHMTAVLVEGRSGYVVNTGQRRGVHYAFALLAAMQM